jgi:hypothetical protein
MIIWLASYPRSGNTLLRQILNQCARRGSYEQYKSKWSSSFSPEAVETAGLLFYEGGWERFYRRASASKEVFLVKTHDLPRDNQPALYVVRDGRAASLSYYQFLRTYHPEGDGTLERVVCGDDAFGGWSDHYVQWMSRADRPLVLRFEELVNCPDELLARIMRFIGHDGPVSVWRNPHERLAQLEPNFFREGAVKWRPKLPWGEHTDLLFFAHHGGKMRELNYYSPGEVERLQSDPLCQAYTYHATLTVRLVSEKRKLQQICDERGTIIDRVRKAIRRGVKAGCLGLSGLAIAGTLLPAIYGMDVYRCLAADYPKCVDAGGGPSLALFLLGAAVAGGGALALYLGIAALRSRIRARGGRSGGRHEGVT